MAPLKIGFKANPAGGPGIFLTRLKAEMEAIGCFDAEHPDVWIELCYNRLPDAIRDNSRIKKLIRTDGVYSLRKHFISYPVKLSLPVLDDWASRRFNARKNRPIRHNLSLADEIVYQSEFSRRATQAFIMKTPPGVVILNGVDVVRFSPDPDRKRNPREVNMLISHSYRPHKRLHEAIRIVAALKKRQPETRWNLHVAGQDDGLSIAYAQKTMRDLELSEEVVFYGKLPFSTLYELYRKCDFAFGLSFWDFCPNVIVEALSCGLPVLGVDSGGIPELVGPAGRLVKEEIAFDYHALYDFNALPKVNAEQYADEALLLLESLEAYQTLARERALEALDIRLTARQYYAACEQLC
jgi:glycosyltransferase involved in cell wall biosynthesis